MNSALVSTDALGVVVRTQEASKAFGPKRAVDAVSLTVAKGTILGLLGRNGAGKTTLINLLTGLMVPSEGTIEVLGIDPVKEPLAVKRRIGVMPQEEGLLDSLTAREYLRFVGAVFELSPEVIDRRTEELLSVLDLDPPASTPVRNYSYGMKKKVGLAAALIHGPELLFLDEPFEGIDPLTARTIKDLLLDLRAKGVTIVLSSHVLEVVERLCDQIAILDEGRLLGLGTLEEMRERTSAGDGESLEDLFVSMLGGAQKGSLSWL